MRSSDTCCSQSHVNSISQIAPMYHNVLAQTSQINFLQQQQQQQQQQPMQSQQYYCYPANQQGPYSQNQYVQPYQQDPYGISQQQQPIPRTGLGNLSQPLAQTSYNVPSIIQPQAIGYGSLPPHMLDQIRSYIGTPGPIFILPSNCPPNTTIQPPQQTSNSTTNQQGCPGIGINCPSSINHGCPAGSCYPCPIAMPMYNPFVNSSQNNVRDSKNCGCYDRKSVSDGRNNRLVNSTNYHFTNEPDEHRCVDGPDDTICTRKNCPSTINLQALASQLLAIQGIISCTATRLVLRKVPGSNVTTSTEETMERAKRSLSSLTKEQLLSETRNSRQVNALINLHMTANPPINVVPILTTLQLKINLLKSHVDTLLNRRLSESQGIGETNGNLDSVMLAMKSDQELRDLLGTLRQKECEERVNLNFAPYQSQRAIAESRLTNVQNKIAQIEEEMDRRRAAILPRSSLANRQVSQQLSDPGCGAWYGYTGDINNTNYPMTNTQHYESPDPFRGIQVRSPKRLNLKPHVGSPETTYEKTRKTTGRSSRSGKDSDDEDCDDGEKSLSNCAEKRCCNCDKSSEDDSADEGKKKLGGKIRETRGIVSTSVNEKVTGRKIGGVSVVKLSPNVAIVIDDSASVTSEQSHRDDKDRKNMRREEELGNEAERENAVDLENREAVASKTLVGTIEPRQDNDTVISVEKPKYTKTPKQTVKLRDQAVEQSDACRDKMAVSAEKMADESYPTASTHEPLNSIGKSDFNDDNNTLESVREETVRMITEIHYEPTVFRGYHDNETTDKENIIEERYKRSFNENSSLKSVSTESTVDSNCTDKSLSLRVENYEESFLDASGQRVSKKNALSSVEKVISTRNVKIQEEDGKIHRIRGNRSKSKIDNKNENNETSNEKDETGDSPGDYKNERRNDLISGALTTIGNHVASFGSIIGKIASLKLHRSEDSSYEIMPESTSKSPDQTKRSVVVNEIAESTSRGNLRKNENDREQEIGQWKYIRFSDVEQSTSAINDNGNFSRDTVTYTLPRIKHSVIEDRSNGEKYVVVGKSSKIISRQFGEPYKIGRSLVIRSRPKSSQTTEQTGPFTVVKGPRQRDKNCIALSLVSVRSLRKNRSKIVNELKSSDKFWLRPETREQRRNIADLSKFGKCPKKDSQGEKSTFVELDSSMNNDTENTFLSVTAADEHVVQIHDYSRIQMNL